MKIYDIHEDQHKIYVGVEYIDGKNLFEYVGSLTCDTLTEEVCANIIKQVLTALNHCHSQNLAHRDIKLDNIMFADPACTKIKVVDFGFAKMFDPIDKKFEEILGSPVYMPPEVITKKPYNEKCDIWSLGVVLYILITGNIPYDIKTNTLADLFELIKLSNFDEEKLVGNSWNHLSKEVKNIISLMLKKDPALRPSAAELLKHPWFEIAKTAKPSTEETGAALHNFVGLKV